MNYEEIKKLIDDMGNSKLDSLDIEFPDGIKISMTKNKNNVVTTSSIVPETVSVPSETSIIDEPETVTEPYYEIKSPMVGTFYSRSTPEKEPFVKVGDTVKKGEPLCIIEAMKLMNEIEAECDGEIIEICMKDEQMVEYGQMLFKIKEKPC